MTTVELERGTYELIDEEDGCDDEHIVGHLYWVPSQTSVCGIHSSQDPHVGRHESIPNWIKGQLSCPKCGVPICMDCVLGVS